MESARIVASIARIVRDVGVAEEIAQDAYVLALESASSEPPDNLAAWLMTTAKNRAINHVRRERMLTTKHVELSVTMPKDEEQSDFDRERERGESGGDDLLRLVFIACHPILSIEARIALTLRLLCGLTTEEIARAFLVPEPTIAQRIVRAKKTLSEAQVPFEMPRRGAELNARLASVLHVVYLVFNEGYAATAGEDWVRPELCEDALRLGRTLVELAPEESEVLGLVALMEIQASRLAARVGPKGEPIPLLDQDRLKWDHLLVHRGLRALERAELLGSTTDSHGPYVLQAAIAACYVRPPAPVEIDWKRIAALYEVLAERLPSPVVELNRAVVIGRAFGAERGLAHTDRLTKEPSLREYHLLPTVRADFLLTLGRHDEARIELERAIAMTRNAREKDVLTARLQKIS